MDAIAELELSDVVFISSASYTRDDGFVLDFISQCAPKPRGELSLQVTPRMFGLDDDTPVKVSGTVLTRNATEAHVRWSVDQSKTGVHVYGSFDSVVRKMPRVREPMCAEPNKTFGVQIAWLDGENTIHADSPFGSVTLSDFSLDAEGGRVYTPPKITARIKPLYDHCGVGAAPGQVARFVAEVEGVPAGDPVQLRWSLSGSGATAVGASDDWLFQVRLGDQPIAVTLTASADDANATATAQYRPEAAWSAHVKEIVCRAKADLLHHMFIDPLLDPLRDLSTHPLEPAELQRAVRVLRRMAQLGAELEHLGRAPGAIRGATAPGR